MFFVTRRRRSLDPNKLRQSKTSEAHLLPSRWTSLPLPRDTPASSGEPRGDEPPKHGGKASLGGSIPLVEGEEAGQVELSDRAGSPIEDELSELLNDSSIERHLSMCVTQLPTSRAEGPHAPLSTSAPDHHATSPRRDHTLHSGALQMTFELTNASGDGSVVSKRASSSSSPLSFDLDSLALQVRERISSIFDHPTPLPPPPPNKVSS